MSITRNVTITDYIEEHKNLSISFDTLHLKEKESFPVDSTGVTNVIIMNDSFVDKYKNDLLEIVDTITFDKEQIRKYYCNPWALSYDLYGSVEFWFLLLDLNDMYSATDFNKKTVKIYNSSLPDLIDTIINQEKNFIDTNNEEIDESDINDTDEDTE